MSQKTINHIINVIIKKIVRVTRGRFIFRVQSYLGFSYTFWVQYQSLLQLPTTRDGNGVGFSDTCPAPLLIERGLNLINGFGTGMKFFFKPGAGSGIAPSRPTPIIYKINFKIKFNLKFYFTIFNIQIIIKFLIK